MRRTALTAVAIATALSLTALPAAATPAAAPHADVAKLKRQVQGLRREVARLRAYSPQEIRKGLQAARQAAERYASVGAATAAGYVPASPCESSPQGAMGVHYVNPPSTQDPALDRRAPEVLLYAPGSSGLELVGVEYFKADADQDLATDGDRPSLFGRAFDGPMAGHAPGMPIHYDLHVWLQKRNPSGVFAQWNPDVRCG